MCLQNVNFRCTEGSQKSYDVPCSEWVEQYNVLGTKRIYDKRRGLNFGRWRGFKHRSAENYSCKLSSFTTWLQYCKPTGLTFSILLDMLAIWFSLALEGLACLVLRTHTCVFGYATFCEFWEEIVDIPIIDSLCWNSAFGWCSGFCNEPQKGLVWTWLRSIQRCSRVSRYRSPSVWLPLFVYIWDSRLLYCKLRQVTILLFSADRKRAREEDRSGHGGWKGHALSLKKPSLFRPNGKTSSF